MLSQNHPDFAAYVKNPQVYVATLYRDIRAAYGSPYTDSTDDIVKAYDALDKALHDGISRETMLEKLKELKEYTTIQYRPSTAKIIRDGYYRKSFIDPITLTPATPAEPWTGPMPQRY